MSDRQMVRQRSSVRPLTVMMTGLRGCPNVQGGVEKHVEQLAPLLVQAGCRIEVLARSPYVRADAPNPWQGVAIARLWTPKSRSFEAVVHTFLCVLYAGWRRPDILHIHAIGPAMLTPLARLLGLKVVVTHHGFDYERGKWGGAAKAMLRTGEYLGMRFANARIAVSSAIANSVRKRFAVAAERIPNGVAVVPAPETNDILDGFGLSPQRYILMVGRLVPEKRHLDVIEAYKRLNLPNWKLAIVGASDHPDGYVRALEQVVYESPGVVMTGFQTGAELAELYANAGVFVLPSSHEGLPIALLEALAYGLPALASDIDANKEIGLADGHYYPVGDVDALAAALDQLVAHMPSAKTRSDERARIAKDYGWPQIAERTLEVYREVAGLQASVSTRAAAST